MTFHMEQTQLKPLSHRDISYEDDDANYNCNRSMKTKNPRLERETLPGPGTGSGIDLQTPQKRMPFPQRLWDAINDSDTMITWTADGCGVLVDEMRFEREVMSLYPGFVQVPNFNNLRRQLRVYNFDWQVLNDHTDNLVFYHPCFQRSHPEMLPYVFTKRRIIKPTKRISSCSNMLDDTSTTDDDQAILPQHSPGTSPPGVSGEASPKKCRRRYKRRKPLRTKENINQHIPDSEELNISPSAYDDENSTEARSISESNEGLCQNSSETKISKVSSVKLCQKPIEAENTSMSSGMPCQNSAEVKSTCNSSERPCEEGVVFQGDMRNDTCDCMFNSSKDGEGDGFRKGGPLYPKQCSVSECSNHICGHCNARWVSNSSSELPSQHVPCYYVQQHPGVIYRAPQERHYPTIPYGYQFMAPMMPPIRPQYVMDANIISTPRSSQPTPLQTMRPADQAVSHATHTRQKASDTKTISSSQAPDQEGWNQPKTYHRLETVPYAVPWQPGYMHNEAYHTFATTQKLSRFEKPDAPWGWNYAPESHVYQIPPNPSTNNYHRPAQTYFTGNNPRAPGTVKSQKLQCIPQAIQVKSTMAMQCGQQLKHNAGLNKSKLPVQGESVPNITKRHHLEHINECKQPMQQGMEDVNKFQIINSKEICRDEGENQSPQDKEGVTCDVEHRDMQQTEVSMVVHKSQIGNFDDKYEDIKHTESSKDHDNHQDLIAQVKCEEKHETNSSVVDQLVSCDVKGEEDSSEAGECLMIVTFDEDCNEVTL